MLTNTIVTHVYKHISESHSMIMTYCEKGCLQGVCEFASKASILGVNTQWCNDSPSEIRHNSRCWASNFTLNETGMTRHHCILTCRTRKDCQFLNYQFRGGRCQLASVCVALHRVIGVEAVLFGKVELLNECANWIPAIEFGNNRGHSCGTGYVARLIMDKYIILGSMLYPTFAGAYYNGLGEPTVVQTTDMNSLRPNDAYIRQ